ncbi:hypothetical protein, partial [Kitasatospora sp. NPDC056181]|uniref:hypothetical protein n=1 Tax=Kitasatospora sp. NPDC056181 TaxID=3345737 RepID=UPI0035DDB6BB
MTMMESPHLLKQLLPWRALRSGGRSKVDLAADPGAPGQYAGELSADVLAGSCVRPSGFDNTA